MAEDLIVLQHRCEFLRCRIIMLVVYSNMLGRDCRVELRTCYDVRCLLNF